MIAITDRQLLIATPPHVGSRALHQYLCRHHHGIWIQGLNPDNYTDHHTNAIGSEFEGWKLAVVVRDPFARLLGLWYHLVDWCRYHGDGTCGFADFVRLVYEDDAAKLSWMYRFTIHRWIGDRVPNHVLRFETLREDLDKLLNTRIEIDSPPPTYRRPVDAYFAGQTITRANAWATHDLKRWGYRPLAT